MKRIATLAAISLVLAPAGAAGERAASGKAKLRAMSLTPLKVKGTGFASRERVVVRVKGRTATTAKRVTASRTGAWVLSFVAVSQDRCNAVVVSAVGSRGSRAGLKLPQPLCPPPL